MSPEEKIVANTEKIDTTISEINRIRTAMNFPPSQEIPHSVKGYVSENGELSAEIEKTEISEAPEINPEEVEKKEYVNIQLQKHLEEITHTFWNFKRTMVERFDEGKTEIFDEDDFLKMADNLKDFGELDQHGVDFYSDAKSQQQLLSALDSLHNLYNYETYSTSFNENEESLDMVTKQNKALIETIDELDNFAAKAMINNPESMFVQNFSEKTTRLIRAAEDSEVSSKIRRMNQKFEDR